MHSASVEWTMSVGVSSSKRTFLKQGGKLLCTGPQSWLAAIRHTYDDARWIQVIIKSFDPT